MNMMMTSPAPSKAVTLIPVFGALDETIDCVRSLLASDAGKYPIWLLDDGSPIEVAQTLRDTFADYPSVRIISHFRNRGYTENLSLALREVDTPYFCILNSDTLVPDLWFDRLIQKLEETPIACAVGPVSNAASYQSVPEVFTPDGRAFSVNEELSSQPADISRYNKILQHYAGNRLIQSMLLNGFCTVFRSRAFHQAGKFDRINFREGYGEENDLFIRMARDGWRCFIDPGVFVYHRKSSSFGADRRAILSKRGNQKLVSLYGSELREEIDTFQSEIKSLKALRLQFGLTHYLAPEAIVVETGQDHPIHSTDHQLLVISGPATITVSADRISVQPIEKASDCVVIATQSQNNIVLDLPDGEELRMNTRQPAISALAAISLISFEKPVFVANWQVDDHPDKDAFREIDFGMLYAAPSIKLE